MTTPRRSKAAARSTGPAARSMSRLMRKLSSVETKLQTLIDSLPGSQGPRVVQRFAIGDVASESMMNDVRSLKRRVPQV